MSDAIVVKKRVGAPPPVVYRYLTESELWARWQGVHARLQPSPGGMFAMSMPNGQRARGEFVELEQDRRVVFSWGWIDHPGVPPGSSTVEIDLAPDGDGTLLTLTHTGLPPAEVDIHKLGWDHYLPRLALVAEGDDPGPDTGPG